MSSEEVPLASLSESSDDIGFLDDYKSRISGEEGDPDGLQPRRRNDDSSSAAPATDDEPEWVRNYTPKRRSDVDRRNALLASLDDDDDDESIIDLISQEPMEKTSAQKHDSVPAPKGHTDPHRQPTAKRMRAPSKPKSQLPLVVAPKVDDSLVLLQSADGNLDLSGDVGAVGRVKLQEGDLFLDIKGVVYRADLIPCNTLCVVSVGDDEARVTATLEEAVILKSERNLFASDEIVVHGDLDEIDDGNADTPQSDDISKDGGQKKTGNGKKKKPGNTSGKSKTKTTAPGKGSLQSKKWGISKPPHRK